MSKPLSTLLFILLVSLWVRESLANPDVALGALHGKAGVLVMRHAQTLPGTGDPVGFRLEDCSTQRDLSDRGRADARALGETLRAAGIEAAKIYASPWCRARETAELLDLGPVEISPLLASVWNDRIVNPDRTDELRLMIGRWTGPMPLILVTHGINVRALLGRSPSQGGGFVVLSDPTVAGRLRIVGPFP